MRGSVSVEQAWMLDWDSRIAINEIIKENLDTTKDTGLPFF